MNIKLKLLAGIAGAEDVEIESLPGSPQMVMKLRPARLTQFGFLPVDVLEGIQTAYQGTEVAQTYEEHRRSVTGRASWPHGRRHGPDRRRQSSSSASTRRPTELANPGASPKS